MMIDPLATGYDFETRSLALEKNLATLDTLFLQQVINTLPQLALPDDVRAFADQWRAELAARGLEALYDPQTPWAGDAKVNPFHRDQQARLWLIWQTLEDGSARDRLIQTLCDGCEQAPDLQLRLAEVLQPMREIAFSPRRSQGRQGVYRVTEGDTLRTIAYYLYGDADAWPTLVATYGLLPPYISPTPQPRQLSPGMVLSSAESRIPDAEADALGETMKLAVTPAGPRQEWDIVAAPEGGIAVVDGMECLLTDSSLRIATPLGDLPEHPTYGMPEVAGLTRSDVTATQFMLASETLKDDPRIGSVSASAHPQSSKLASNIFITPRSSEALDYPGDTRP